jgi:hypothetical protein
MQCACCGSVRLTPPGELLTNQGTVMVAWDLVGETGWFKNRAAVMAQRVVMCGDCGYFMIFATQEALQRVRDQWSLLVPQGP